MNVVKNKKLHSDKKLLKLLKTDIGMDVISKKNEGTYGTIYYANNISRDVIKIFKNSSLHPDFINEVSCLSALSKYTCFPQLKNIFYDKDYWQPIIIMSNCGNSLRHKYIKNCKLNYSLQLLNVYNILNHEQIIHRDIKSNNLCVKNGKLSIIDFGFSRQYPHIINDSYIININKHIEFIQNTYYTSDSANQEVHANDYKLKSDNQGVCANNYNMFWKNIDMMSIFNMFIYIFNSHDDTQQNYIYHNMIDTHTHQLDNIIYLLLTKNNTYKIRDRIYRMITSLGIKYYSPDVFHITFGKSRLNKHIYEEYNKRLSNIPAPIYKILKKILNINPNSRISFDKLYQQMCKTYPTMKNNMDMLDIANMVYSDQPIFIFDKIVKYDNFIQNDAYTRLNTVFRQSIPSSIYSLTIYQFMKNKDQFKKSEYIQLYALLIFINYTSKYAYTNCEDMDYEFFFKYLKIVNADIHGNTPYQYQKYMNLYKWNNVRNYLFDYFTIIASCNPVFCNMNPFLLALVITMVIYRVHQKIDISMDYKKVYQCDIIMPSYDCKPFYVNKKNFAKLTANKHLINIVNNFYSFYAKLFEQRLLNNLNKYFVDRCLEISTPLLFFIRQCIKNISKRIDNI